MRDKGEIILSKLIALSDGHGVDTAGKRTPTLPNGQKSETGKVYMNENLFNRAVVNYLDAELKRNGFKTILVAPTDADTPLANRTSLADAKGVDLYLSIHANASTGKFGSWGGIETYTWKTGESLRIGKLIHAEVIKGSPLSDRGVKDGSHLWEINKSKAPAILCELGFMDSHNDYKYLLSDAYRKECAVEIAMGVCKAYGVTYKAEVKLANKVTPTPVKAVTKQPVKPKAPIKASTTLPTGTYKKGSKGNAVKQIQNALNKLYFKCGTADGIWGAKTTDALKRFQSIYTPHDVDGIYGVATRKAMLTQLNK